MSALDEARRIGEVDVSPAVTASVGGVVIAAPTAVEVTPLTEVSNEMTHQLGRLGDGLESLLVRLESLRGPSDEGVETSPEKAPPERMAPLCIQIRGWNDQLGSFNALIIRLLDELQL